MATRFGGTRLVRRARRALTAEHGFTIVETLMAGVILLILATGIAGVLTSSIAANTVARERTGAEQCANDLIEQIRRKAYDKVGLVSGNPPGTVSPTAACGNGINATATVTIGYVDDPTPTSYATAANYKKVTVTVTRDRDGKQLARFSTFVAPEGRAPYGGINNAIINATVVDLGLNQPYVGATVSLTKGPSPDRSDTTDSTGTVSFAALTPNPTSGPTAYYDLTVTAATGYETLASDLPPGTATPPATASHIQLAPAQTSNTTIQIYKPATINLVATDGSGDPFTAGAALRITSSFTGATTSDTLAAGASGKTLTLLGGNKIVPGATYTVEGRTTSGLCAMPAASPVPASGYPGNTTGTFSLQFTPCPTGDLAVNVKQLGLDVAGATVTVSGGPNSMSFTGTTDASGNVTISVPEGTGYTVTASKGQTGSASASATQGSTTNVNVVLADPPSGTLNVTVKQLAAGVSGATVTLSGGPWSIGPVSGTTNGSGVATFSSVPAGSGYTIVAAKGSDTNTITQTVSTGTTNATVALPDPPTGSIRATVTWLGSSVAGATVTLDGGPYGINVSGTSNSSGIVDFINVPAGSGYTVTATKNGQSAAAGSVSVTTGSTTNVALALPTATLTVTATWADLPAGLADVTVSGGPNGGTYSGTTDLLSGEVTITVPTTTTNNYTVSVSKNTGTGTGTVSTVPSSGASTTVTIGPTKNVTVTVQQGGSVYKNKSVLISVTGGPNGVGGTAPAYTTSPSPTKTDKNGRVTVQLPAANGYVYTVKASVSPCAGGANTTGTSTSPSPFSSAAASTSVTVNMDAKLTCPYTP